MYCTRLAAEVDPFDMSTPSNPHHKPGTPTFRHTTSFSSSSCTFNMLFYNIILLEIKLGDTSWMNLPPSPTACKPEEASFGTETFLPLYIVSIDIAYFV